MQLKPERMQLGHLDLIRYFMPTLICAYLAILCIVLIVTSAFLVSLQNAVAVTAAGFFGLLLTGGLGYLFWRSLRRDLLFVRVCTHETAAINYEAVHRAALRAGWKIFRAEPGERLDAQTAVLLLSVGERVEVHFVEKEVLIGSICDPSVGFSLAGRRHCRANREVVRQAVLPPAGSSIRSRTQVRQ